MRSLHGWIHGVPEIPFPSESPAPTEIAEGATRPETLRHNERQVRDRREMRSRGRALESGQWQQAD